MKSNEKQKSVIETSLLQMLDLWIFFKVMLFAPNDEEEY